MAAKGVVVAIGIAGRCCPEMGRRCGEAVPCVMNRRTGPRRGIVRACFCVGRLVRFDQGPPRALEDGTLGHGSVFVVRLPSLLRGLDRKEAPEVSVADVAASHEPSTSLALPRA